MQPLNTRGYTYTCALRVHSRCTHTYSHTHPLPLPGPPILTPTPQYQKLRRREVGVSPRLTCWTPVETQEKFLAQITWPPAKSPGPLSLGWGSED